MENVSNLRGLQRQCVHALSHSLSVCVCLLHICVCILVFVRNRHIYMKRSKERLEKTELDKEQKNMEKLACIEGCNLIY